MRFQREALTESLAAELTPLLQAHWKEIAHYHDIQLNPAWEAYFQLDNMGVTRFFTVRADDGKLCGYAVFVIRANLHYKDSLQATQDVLFLEPSQRGKLVGLKFIKWCDAELKKEGVQVSYHHVKTRHNFGPMLERIGYEAVDIIYARRLDRRAFFSVSRKRPGSLERHQLGYGQDQRKGVTLWNLKDMAG